MALRPAAEVNMSPKITVHATPRRVSWNRDATRLFFGDTTAPATVLPLIDDEENILVFKVELKAEPGPNEVPCSLNRDSIRQMRATGFPVRSFTYHLDVEVVESGDYAGCPFVNLGAVPPEK